MTGAIPDILEQHFEELEFLWQQRNEALRAPDYTLDELAELEERIAAHTDGLVLGGEEAVPVVREGLTSDESSTALAAAYTLLEMENEDAARLVLEAFQEAKDGGTLEGIRAGLCYGPIDSILSHLREISDSKPPTMASAAAEALAFHSLLNPNAARLGEFCRDEDAQVRRAAWRLVMLTSTHGLLSPDVSSQLSEAAARNEDPTVRREAMLAAAWTRQPWLLDHCRKLSFDRSPEDWDAILLLAILGQPSDLERILAIARAAELGPIRFQALATFGHPDVVELLLEGMGSEDAATAAAAGEAFTKITGFDVESDERVTVPPEDGSEPDEFEQEFLDEVNLPDPEAARAHWEKVKEDFSQGTRWRRGLNLSEGTTDEILPQLDLESRWETCLRGRFEGTWQESLVSLEVFPQTRG